MVTPTFRGFPNRGLTIVMYHYVRELVCSRYPGIKGRSVAEFSGQLEHIAQNYTVITAEAVIAALKGGPPLPPNACWLTFDDGYIDHYTVVFPALHRRGWQGTFFPPASAIRDRRLLDVNRVHFVLAAQPDAHRIVADIRDYLEEHREIERVRTYTEYWNELARASRFDPAEVVFVKRMLQHALPELARHELADLLFRRYVSVDAETFASELYATSEQLKLMIDAGMHVGSHGDRHYWLDRLDEPALNDDIRSSLDFLASLGMPTQDWIMCYPFGAYSRLVIDRIREAGAAVALTTEVGVADLRSHDALALPRLDTNDLPTCPA